MSTSEREQPPHIAWVDALRGIASFGVAHFHALGIVWVGWEIVRRNPLQFSKFDRIQAPFSLPAHFGYSTVMLFFVISGFCIHWPYARSGRDFNGAIYAVRRFLRIYPPYLAAVVLSAVIGAVLYRCGFWPVPDSSKLIAESVAMVQNYAVHAAAFPNFWDMQLHANSSLWSLPIEAEFYVAYPILWFALRSFGMTRVFFVVAGLSLVMSAIAVAAPHFAFGTDFLSYWAIWLMGAMVAQLVAEKRVPTWTVAHSAVLALLVIIGCAARAVLHMPGPVENFVWGAAYTLVIVRLIAIDDGLTRWLSRSRVLVGMGRISYSLYLVHMPIYFAVAAFWALGLHRVQGSYIVCILLTLTALPVAWLFYRFVEVPSIAAAHGVSARLVPKNDRALAASPQ